MNLPNTFRLLNIFKCYSISYHLSHEIHQFEIPVQKFTLWEPPGSKASCKAWPLRNAAGLLIRRRLTPWRDPCRPAKCLPVTRLSGLPGYRLDKTADLMDDWPRPIGWPRHRCDLVYPDGQAYSFYMKASINWTTERRFVALEENVPEKRTEK